MKTPIENGLTACNSQPAKTTFQSTINFIAIYALPASLDVVFVAVWTLLALNVWEMLQ